MSRCRRRWASWRAEARGPGLPGRGALGPLALPDGRGGTGLACVADAAVGWAAPPAGWATPPLVACGAGPWERGVGLGGTLPPLELCLVLAICAFLLGGGKAPRTWPIVPSPANCGALAALQPLWPQRVLSGGSASSQPTTNAR